MSFSVTPQLATTPVVLALDVGSTGTRGGLFDATGLPVGRLRHKVRHQFTTSADGTSTIDADQVVAEVAEVIDTVCRMTRDLGKRTPVIAGVGIDTFASSLVGIDGDGRAITPCITYADSRCAAQVAALRTELDEAEVQQRTGTRIHTSYLPARFWWLRQDHPKLWQQAARWMSLSEYIHLRLAGDTAAGTSIAAWTGLLDRHTAGWDPELLDVCGIGVDRLSPVQHPSQGLSLSDRPADLLTTKTWAMLAEAHWSPGISDGHASNVGAGGTDPRSAVIAAATSGAMRVLVDHVPDRVGSGLWCYRVDEAHSIVGGALNDVGRAVSWLESTVQLPDPRALAALLRADPDPDTPLVLPFLSGERSTGWAGRARAVVTGLGAAHDGGALARGMFEGIAISYARVAAQLSEVAGAPRQILASGRVSADLPDLLPVLADVLQAPVTPVTIKRSTLRGTALVTLDIVAPEIARAEPTTGDTIEPHPGRAEHYQQRLVEFEKVYDALIG